LDLVRADRGASNGEHGMTLTGRREAAARVRRRREE